jgi:glycine/D-amino acid oxidase-like deaminating enzyme
VRTGEFGHWWQTLGGPPTPRPRLPGAREFDVAIVGAGYTGLWTAYYLLRAEPSLRVCVIESRFAGHGASGRNGGWVSGFFTGPARVYERNGGPDAFRRLQRAMFATVDEVGSVIDAEQIDADFHKGGTLTVARNRAQAARVRANVADARAAGLSEEDMRVLETDELQAQVRVAGASCAAFSPHVARVHPARLVRGLAAAVERRGGTIYEDTPALAIAPRSVQTAHGSVTARWIVRATEGYTASLQGLRRALVPMNSSMIVTEPLPEQAWQEIGWENAQTMSDGASVYVYLQRTADGRIAIGGRGRPYRFGSRTDRAAEIPAGTVAGLQRSLDSMFPMLAGAPLAHGWSGVLGVPRDWCVSVHADAERGLAWGGGYVGEGVAASNLVGRMLGELVLGGGATAGPPWVGRRSPRWEPEPLRWMSITAVYALYRMADRLEARTGSPSRLARLVDSASGRH